MYALISLKSGERLISQFTKLRGLGSYASKVMSGQKALNVWTIISTTHPASGERCLVRTRRQISGSDVVEMQEVTPRASATPQAVARLEPEAFEPALQIEKGPHGLHTFAAGEDLPVGAQAGIPYPLHRDPQTLHKYVVLRAANGDVTEQRHEFVEGAMAGVTSLPETEEVENFDDDDDIFGDG